MHSDSHAHQHAPSGHIHLRLRELAQLFNSLDPSPFLDRDLDADAEEFIVGWVAMWRPLEVYLYDWWPLRAEARVLRALSHMRVRVVLPESTSP